MYCWFVRNTYLENRMKVPGATVQCGVPVDYSTISVPTYVLATREDHIVPWQTAFVITQLVSGEVRFVLGASGHIAGVINPAARNKRSFWTDGSGARALSVGSKPQASSPGAGGGATGRNGS